MKTANSWVSTAFIPRIITPKPDDGEGLTEFWSKKVPKPAKNSLKGAAGESSAHSAAPGAGGDAPLGTPRPRAGVSKLTLLRCTIFWAFLRNSTPTDQGDVLGGSGSGVWGPVKASVRELLVLVGVLAGTKVPRRVDGLLSSCCKSFNAAPACLHTGPRVT